MAELSGLVQRAHQFLQQVYQELDLPNVEARLSFVESEIRRTGTYIHTQQELEHGARMAWRNSNRCMGRLFWKSLIVKDKRQLETAEDVYDALIEHLDFATNKGKILPTITIFKPQMGHQKPLIRILNHQLIAYAGYKDDRGNTIGDPKNIGITNICIQYGWKPKYGKFDLLPLLIEAAGKIVVYELPTNKIIEVPLTHPDHPNFKSLELKWYGLPVISDMILEIGGIYYPASPFNGWYMVTEIGSRNLGDKQRYNILPELATALQIDTGKHNPLWKDKALIILNEAVLYSFQQKGISLVDHHTASDQFMKFVRNEGNEGREVTADWTWIVPPMSGSATEAFHLPMDNTVKSPNFYYNNISYDGQVVESKCPFHIKYS